MNAKNTSEKILREQGLKHPGDVEGAKLDKYLTDMKELPPSSPTDEELKKVGEEKKRNEVHHELPKKETYSLKNPEVLKPSLKNEKSRPDQENSSNLNLDELGQGNKKFPLSSKDVILGIINLISVVLFVIILSRFPGRSRELKELRVQDIRNNSNVNLEFNEIEVSKPKAEKLQNLFLDEGGVVDFVNDIESQKTEGGAISKVNFASQKAVKDRVGNFGVPIVIELTGSWEAIDTDLQKIDNLPYLYRPVKVEIGYDLENPLVVIFKYGVFLYVSESLGQTR